MQPSRRWVRALARLSGAILLLHGAVAGRGALADPGPDAEGGSTPATGSARRTPYSLLQLNLCLSGMAPCFDDTHYPKVVEEAIDVIALHQPSAVSFNEGCSGDIAHVAEETQYHRRFAPVLVHGRRLPCVDPSGRGVFGNAVITKKPIHTSTDRAFAAQVDGQEHRRWICVQTVRGISVCTAHLSTRGTDTARAVHRSQCEQFAAVVASRDKNGPVMASGDINHGDACAPVGMRTLADARASQLRGKQHSYVSADEFRRPRVQILPAAYSDHDFMLTKAFRTVVSTPDDSLPSGHGLNPGLHQARGPHRRR